MVLLYSLHLSTSKKHFGKPSVASEDVGGIVGHHFKGQILKPCAHMVRAALPHYYRAAFDRAAGAWWFSQDKRDQGSTGLCTPYLTLRDKRGRWINTLYAIPYDFDPNTTPPTRTPLTEGQPATA